MKRERLSALLICLLSLGLLLAGGTAAVAGEYPDQPVKVIVGWAPGGGVDMFTRIVGKYAPKYIGNIFVVSNKKGGAGMIALNSVLRTRPDGYTLAAAMLPNLIYQPMLRPEGSNSYGIDDFIQLGTPVRIPSAFHVRKDSPFKTLQEVIDYAKANPDKLKFGTNGIHSGGHGLLLMFMQEAGVAVTPVHYNAGAKQIKGLLGGEIDVAVTNAMHTVSKHNDLRTLAVAGEKRYRLAEEAPTFREQGLDIVDYVTRCIVAPKGTPEAVVAHLREGFLKMRDDPQFVADLERVGLAEDYSTAEETQVYIREFIRKHQWIFDQFRKEMAQ